MQDRMVVVLRNLKPSKMRCPTTNLPFFLQFSFLFNPLKFYISQRYCLGGDGDVRLHPGQGGDPRPAPRLRPRGQGHSGRVIFLVAVKYFSIN